MPLTSSVSRVALPIIRDLFQLQADMTAWVAVAFTLPFVALMPVYGRVSDGLGARRLILVGALLSSIGALLTAASPTLGWVMVGMAIQGIGLAGMTPLGLALISATFRRDRNRIRVLATWSTVGPTTGFVAPLVGGLLVAAFGWRSAFVPPLIIGMVAFLVAYRGIPPDTNQPRPGFLRSFDWVGVVLLTAATTALVFYLSSRPITGVAPLRDWRLLALTIVLFGAFWWWERRQKLPFVSFGVFGNRLFGRATFCAAMRMVVMGGLGFLVPLYLVDVHELSLAQLGGALMISPGVLAPAVGLGGRLSARWGQRWVVILGLGVQGSVMLIFSWLSAETPVWIVYLNLAYYGAGAGLILAPLHHAALRNMSSTQAGMASGLYSMLRFLGSVVGTALAGVLLQSFIEQSIATTVAYQRSFLAFAAFAVAGMIVGLRLERRTSNAAIEVGPLPR